MTTIRDHLALNLADGGALGRTEFRTPHSALRMGFTLIELLVVIAIIAILAGIPMPAQAQTTFTRITEGDLVNDPGAFAGAAWADFNQDGLLDVFLSHYGGMNAFYRNDGRGTFTKISQAAPVQDIDAHTIPAWGDYDNDGNVDLLVPAGLLSPQATTTKLYRNNGDGTLAPVSSGDLTAQLGYFGGGWVDYDNDGFLDVFLTSVATEQGGRGLLFRNNGDGTFAKTESSPLTSDRSVNLALLWADYDNDGFSDLFLVNNQSDAANLLYHNDRNGAFSRVLTGVIGTDRAHDHPNGGAWGDYDNDGFLDLFLATSTGGGGFNRLYHNNSNGTFTKITSGPMLPHTGVANSITGAWGDYDNDGYLDLFVSNDGGLNQLFHNNGSRGFTQILTGAPVDDSGVGCSWVDFDNDGFLDLLVLGSTPKPFYRNDGNTNAWLEVKCVGTVSNRSAIGAKVRVLANVGGRTFWQLREVRTGTGYNTGPLIAHFGLGNSSRIEVLRIEWPSGTVQELRDVPAKQILTVTEPLHLSAGLLNGVPQITLKGGRGFRYRIDSSADLHAWEPLDDPVITNLNGTVSLIDTARPDFAQRFYRGVQVAQ